jgi:HTH-type transcriptional regulator / antitoxin HipB
VAAVRTVGDVGAVIRVTRVGHGWTQEHLAQQAGVSRRWVVAIESGTAARAELERVLRVLVVLGVTLTCQTPTAFT